MEYVLKIGVLAHEEKRGSLRLRGNLSKLLFAAVSGLARMLLGAGRYLSSRQRRKGREL